MSTETRTLVVHEPAKIDTFNLTRMVGVLEDCTGLAPGTYEVTLTKREEPVEWHNVRAGTEGNNVPLPAYTALITGADGVERRVWVLGFGDTGVPIGEHATCDWDFVNELGLPMDEAKRAAEEHWRGMGQ